MKTVVLSPHPDDAVLSLGATIAHMTSFGRDVLVVNFTGTPDRLEEDERALSVLGARSLNLGLDDALYRGYAFNDIFRGPRSDDPARDVFVSRLIESLSEEVLDTVYCPLAMGNHVDHVLVNRAGKKLIKERGSGSYFYEDYPYAKHCTKDEGAVSFLPTKELVELKIKAIAQYGSQLAPLFVSPTLMESEVARYFTSHGERVWRSK